LIRCLEALKKGIKGELIRDFNFQPRKGGYKRIFILSTSAGPPPDFATPTPPICNHQKHMDTKTTKNKELQKGYCHFSRIFRHFFFFGCSKRAILINC